MQISWEIEYLEDEGLFQYQYTFSQEDGGKLKKEVCLWLLEVSPSITKENVDERIFDLNFNESNLKGPKTYDPGFLDCLPPGDIYAVKFDIGTDFAHGGVAYDTYTFKSTQSPIWGDFYVQGGLLSAAWNKGYGTDPTSTTTNFKYWIPTPDTLGPPPVNVPTPSTLVALMGAAIVGLAARRMQHRTAA